MKLAQKTVSGLLRVLHAACSNRTVGKKFAAVTGVAAKMTKCPRCCSVTLLT